MIRSFDHPFLEKNFFLLPPYTRNIWLPESRVLYTVLRSPHIDQKSREQFEMEIKKKGISGHKERHELRKKFFLLKRVYVELNMKSYFLARPVRIRENSRDCFEYYYATFCWIVGLQSCPIEWIRERPIDYRATLILFFTSVPLLKTSRAKSPKLVERPKSDLWTLLRILTNTRVSGRFGYSRTWTCDH